MNKKIAVIKKLSKNIELLYVEDNIKLCNNVQQLLIRMFKKDNIIIAHDGKEGYQNFLKYRPKIIMTDLNMPVMNGFTMLKQIQALEPESKFIILAATNEKEDLLNALNLGVFRYLSKPAKVLELVDALYDTILSIEKDENRRILFNQIKNIFDYQNNIVVMMFEGKFILPNYRFLEFFGVETLDEFDEKYDMNTILLEHKDFLYTSPIESWHAIASKNPGKLFHSKVENQKKEKRHLILKLRDLAEKEGYTILSFDDITELNLMGLYDRESANNDSIAKNKNAILSLLRVVKENAGELKIHNYYKGLTIVNPVVLVDITDEGVTLKTVHSQLKIANITKVATISSDIFPQDITCRSIRKIDTDNQTMVASEMNFAQRTAKDRKYIRLDAGEDSSCNLSFKNIKFPGDITIIDISEVSIKVEISALPAGININDKMSVSINFKVGKIPTAITTEGSLFRKHENKHSYYLVIIFELNAEKNQIIKEYLINRQMELIREFKNLSI